MEGNTKGNVDFNVLQTNFALVRGGRGSRRKAKNKVTLKNVLFFLPFVTSVTGSP